MIQDIGKGRFHNEYHKKCPGPESRVLSYQGDRILVRRQKEKISFLTYKELTEQMPETAERYTYLFAIDSYDYFLVQGIDEKLFSGFTWENTRVLREVWPREAAFAGITGHQLADWYNSRQFCPRCGKKMVRDEKERMMRCMDCGLMEYPKICPAVIVAVTNGDRLLLTKYAGGSYRRYALIAGFTEIGETVEETVEREVMEEVGLKVKNIRYYKSQPWSFTGTLLMGFFADLDGEDKISLDESELSTAEWCERDDIPEDDGVSLTREMMRIFKEGNNP